MATGNSTLEQAMQSWMNSPGHRDNILNPQFRELGVGYYFLANNTGTVNYKHYWTLGFWYTRVGFAVMRLEAIASCLWAVLANSTRHRNTSSYNALYKVYLSSTLSKIRT
jgi:hypothetical protein